MLIVTQEFAPVSGICEFLTAVHIYADEARKGHGRYVDSFHYCSHVRDDLRQCLIYDSHEPGARLIGIEYMVPAHVYETFPDQEKALWHSHEFEVKSGMLILPCPAGTEPAQWEATELQAMKEIVGLYGKTWHFWEIDAGHQYPLGPPRLMGSATARGQIDLDTALEKRNAAFSVDHTVKAEARKNIQHSGVHPKADSWWNTGASGS